MNSRPLSVVEAANLAEVNRSGTESAALFLTATGLDKHILDATEPVRRLLAAHGFHDYGRQAKGPEHRMVRRAVLMCDDALVDTRVSLYRPLTKHGDPRLWVRGLAGFAAPGQACAIFVDGRTMYVINLTRSCLAERMKLGTSSPVVELLQRMSRANRAVCDELLLRLREIAGAGPIPAVCCGPTAVGRSIEASLGIRMNPDRRPDYQGIELKSGRSSLLRPPVRATLFACVPDWHLSALKSSKAILEAFGYARAGAFRLYCSVSSLRYNAQGLRLSLDEARSWLKEISSRDGHPDVCVWTMDRLHRRLVEKHNETFWITATVVHTSFGEGFQLESVVHTTRPSAEHFDRLVDSGMVTLDHLIKRTPSGGVHERGPLFKIPRRHIPELFLGEPRRYGLRA